ncbi:MAG: hypothetical protein IKK66_11130 [Ruminococcus sp.]|nr:hypothetical protein [Ruminococcus sp.]
MTKQITEIDAAEASKRRIRHTALLIINAVCLFFGVPTYTALTFGMSDIIAPFYSAIFFENLLIVVFYLNYRESGKLKLPLNILRVVTVLTIAVSLIPTAILMKFTDKKEMYSAKRQIFTNGVRYEGGRETTLERFPEQLPENIEDYFFHTDINKIAPDYVDMAFLSFRTDRAAVEQFEAECKKKGYKSTDLNKAFEKYVHEEKENIEYLDDKEIISYLKQEFYIDQGLTYDTFEYLDAEIQAEILGNTVLYTCESEIPHGYAFNYDSGLVIIWEGGVDF